MIRFVGLGLSIDTITLGALHRLLSCSKIYLDVYTSLWFPSVKLLAEILRSFGIEVVEASRKELEGASVKIVVEEATSKDICIAVAGDPMIATTHSAIVVEALGKGVGAEVLPATSILNTAVSISCLQSYRFGKMVTVVKPKNGIIYEYPLHIIKMNRGLNLHTLVLLEIDVESGYYMTPREALEILLEIQKRVGDEVITENDKVVILRALGSKSASVSVETAKEIIGKSYEKTLYTLIIPAKTLHPVEEECLRVIDRVKIEQVIDIDTLIQLATYMRNKFKMKNL